MLDCSFSIGATSFPNHFYGIHQTQTVDFQYDVCFTIVLNPNDQHVVLRVASMLFLLRYDLNHVLGNIVYVIFFGGIHRKEFFSYHLEVKSGQTSLTMETIPPSILQDDKHSTNFVLIPKPLNIPQGPTQIEFSFHQPSEAIFGLQINKLKKKNTSIFAYPT
jgi:hypothetical protein